MAEWEMVGDYGVLTLNNPPQNYLIEPEFVHLSDLQRWTSNKSLKGLIVQGKGRHFSAGADRGNIFKVQGEDGIRNTLRRGKDVFDHLWNLPIPVIAAIKGVCLGGGLEVAISCHIRISSNKSIFSFPETGLGVMPGLHGTVKTSGLIGMANAIDMILTGKTIDAQEALRLKLVDYVVPPKEVFDFSLKYLKELTEDRPISVIHSVIKSFNYSLSLPDEEAIEEGIKMFCELADYVGRNQNA